MRNPLLRLSALLLVMLLSACQALPKRDVPPPASAPDPKPDVAVTAASVLSEPEAIVPDVALVEPLESLSKTTTAPPPDLWQQMRAGFALPGCDYAPGAERWARRYAASPKRFAAVLHELLPALDYSHRRIQAANLPSEFALLAIVESHYRPYPGSSAQPAGIWQMVGPTARSAGLRVDAWFDGRLNLAASTEAAIVLFDRYGDYFNGDWRLVAFAYNAGEFRIRRALDRHRPGADFASLRGLRIAETSYDYLTKLLALSCLVREPERFDLQLPQLADSRRLHAVELDGTVGQSLARALSGLSDTDFDRVNSGNKRGRTPPGDRQTLLVTGDRVEQAARLLAAIPPSRRLDWQRRRLGANESLADIAERHALSVDVVLGLNGGDADGLVTSGNTLWLPGGGTSARRTEAAPDDTSTDVHIVRNGDSLWRIARRYGLTVADLLRYNSLDHARLMPGQRLRLTSP